MPLTPRRWAMVFLLSLVAVTAAGDSATDALVRTFLEAMQSGDIEQFSTPALRALQSHPEWREILDRYSCIRVRSWGTEPAESGTIRLFLDATGVMRGATQREVALAPQWLLEVAADGSITSARSLEAAAFAAVWTPGSTVDWEALLAARPELDRRRFTRELATVAGMPGAHGQASVAWAIRSAQAIGDVELEAYCLAMASRDARVEWHYETAIELANRAMALADSVASPDDRALALFMLGLAQWLQGDPAAGAATLRASGAMSDRLDDPRIALRSRYMAGYIETSRGELRAALATAQALLADASRYGWTEGVVVASEQLGELHRSLGEDDVALDYFRRAQRLARQVHLAEMEAVAWREIAAVSLRNNDNDQALRSFEEAGRLADFAGSLASLADSIPYAVALTRAGRFADAETFLRGVESRALGAHEEALSSVAQTHLSDLMLATGRDAEALCYAEEALRSRVGDCLIACGTPEWPALLRKGRALAALGRRDVAVETLQEAIAGLEQQLDTSSVDDADLSGYFEGRIEPYLPAIALLAEEGRTREALTVVEKMRARSLKSALRGGRADRDEPLTAAEKAQADALNQRLADLNKKAIAGASAALRAELAEARLALDRFRAQMAMAHPILELRHQQIDDAGARMPNVLTDAVLIEFAVLDDETIAFAVTRGRGDETKIVSHRIAISRKTLAARVNELTTRVARRTLGYSASARRLYRLLLKPFEAEIAAHHTVCIIPDGVLWHLPFQVLQDASHQPLVARAAVMYAPSMAMLAAARTRDGHRGDLGPLVAFANPELPAAEAEVRSLARLYGATRSRVYVGGAARESTFKREVSTAGILHLATHGFLEDRAPMYSALVLAAGGVPAEDGLLEAREILAMHVPAALVVLAACDSGRGVVREGEGLIGMTWALLVAGCPTTVVSQWKADSAATADLMVDFHRGLLAGRTPADALREAQLKLLRGDSHRHPYYWAPFVVIGDGQRVLHVAGR